MYISNLENVYVRNRMICKDYSELYVQSGINM